MTMYRIIIEECHNRAELQGQPKPEPYDDVRRLVELETHLLQVAAGTLRAYADKIDPPAKTHR